MPRVRQSNGRTFKMQTGCLSHQVSVATDDGDLPRLSRCIQRNGARSLDGTEREENRVGNRVGKEGKRKKKEKKRTGQLRNLQSPCSAIPVFGRTGFAGLLIWLGITHFRANMRNRGHARRTRKSGSRMFFRTSAVLSVKVREFFLTVTAAVRNVGHSCALTNQ